MRAMQVVPVPDTDDYSKQPSSSFDAVSGATVVVSETEMAKIDSDSGHPDGDDDGYGTEHSLCCLSRTFWPRMAAIRICKSPWLDRLSMLVVFLNCITLATYVYRHLSVFTTLLFAQHEPRSGLGLNRVVLQV